MAKIESLLVRGSDVDSISFSFESIEITAETPPAEIGDSVSRNDFDAVLIHEASLNDTVSSIIYEFESKDVDLPIYIVAEFDEEYLITDVTNAEVKHDGTAGDQIAKFQELDEQGVTQDTDIDTSQMFYAIASNSPDAIIAVDSANTVKFANSAIERILGYSPDELLGESLLTIIPERLQNRHIESFNSYLETGEKSLDWNSVEFPGLHKDGSEVPLQISFNEFHHQGKQYFAGIIRDRTEFEQLSTELELYFERMTDAFLALDSEFNITYINERASELLEVDRDAILGENLRDEFPEAIETTFADQIQEAFEKQETRRIEEYYPPLDTWFQVTVYPSDTGLSIYFNDITDRKRQEQQIRQQRNKLAFLTQLNSIIQEIYEGVLEAESEEEILEIVVPRFIESTHIDFGWYGEVQQVNQQLSPMVSSDGYDEYLEEQTASLAEEPNRTLPTEAIESETLVVNNNLAAEDNTSRWEKQAAEYDFKSALSIPIVYQDINYGVLTFYDTDTNAFGDEEIDVLEQLSEMLGHAINAIELKQGLLTDNRIELEFSIGAPNRDLFRLAKEFATTIEFRGTASTAGPEQREFYRITDIDFDEFKQAANNMENIDSVNYISDSREGQLVSITFTHTSGSELVAQYGGEIESLTIQSEGADLTVTLPKTVNIQEFIDTLQDEFQDVDLRAKRARDRPEQIAQNFRSSFEKSLTSRQREALETAYHGGYFEWPRGSNAEEIADTMGISAPTLHEHLRSALSKLLSNLFDSNPSE
ncbi:MAG: PAS domain S-box protein [Halobacteriaceae archaeon]